MFKVCSMAPIMVSSPTAKTTALAKPGQEDPTTSIIIVVLVLFLVAYALSKNSVVIRLRPIYQNDCQHSDCHSCKEKSKKVPIDDLVVGDVVKLSAGDH